MDALSISAIIVASTGLIVSTLSVIKHSECCKCLTLDTRTPIPSPNRERENFNLVSFPPPPPPPSPQISHPREVNV